DSTKSPNPFLNTGDPGYLELNISNSGGAAASGDVPIYFWFTDALDSVQNRCVFLKDVGLPNGIPNGTATPGSEDGWGVARIKFTVPTDANKPAWNVTAYLNRDPKAGGANAGLTYKTCDGKGSGYTLHDPQGLSDAADPSTDDAHHAFASF